MGVCIYPNSICQDKASSVNVHRSIGLGGNFSSSVNELNENNKIMPNYQIKKISYKIKISLIFFCNNDNLKNSFTYKFQLYIDNSDIEEENFILLGSTEASICQNKIRYQKVFETDYYFSKGQRIKICCLENERNINTSMFYLGKMLNGFEDPKLIIEKDDNKIGELLILINPLNNIKSKKCLFFFNILNKAPGKGDFFFTINKNSEEVIYCSNLFNSENKRENAIFNFIFEIRKNIIFDNTQYISLNLYKIKENNKSNNLESNKDKDIKDKKDVQNKNISTENEFVDSIKITYNQLLENSGINLFKISLGIFSLLLNESISFQIHYEEKEYVSFYEYIRCQLHLNLVLILNKNVLKKYSSGIKDIINSFLQIVSLYNHDEYKLIYLKKQKIVKVNNYIDLYKDFINVENEDINNNNEIMPAINYIYNNYINKEKNKGVNKYFIILIFTDEKYSDLNTNKNYNSNIYFPNYEEYSNSPISFKIFNFGDKNNYIEKSDININIFKNINENIKYNRIIFQFYNINGEINDKKKILKYLNDIPYLIEDYFEIQKLGKFSIFDD